LVVAELELWSQEVLRLDQLEHQAITVLWPLPHWEQSLRLVVVEVDTVIQERRVRLAVQVVDLVIRPEQEYSPVRMLESLE
jgi:hypothetical protein